MKKQTKHLLALALSMMFVGAGVAGGTIAYNAANEPVTASAEGETYTYSGTVGTDAYSSKEPHSGGLYFRGAPNGAHASTDWATRHVAASASAIQRIRGGETTDVGTGAKLIKYVDNSKIAEYFLEGVGALQAGDVYVLNGDFVDAEKDSVITCQNVRLKVAGTVTVNTNSGPVQQFRTVVDNGTNYEIGQMCKNWSSSNTAGGIYFQTPSNDAPFNGDWSVVYMPDLGSNVQLTREGQTYDIGFYATYDNGTIKKLAKDSYYFDVAVGASKAGFTIQEGDVITVKGTFRNKTASITVEETTLTYKGGAWIFGSDTVYKTSGMMPAKNGFGTDGNGNVTGAYFTMKEENGAYFVKGDWTTEYKATSASNMKLTRNGKTMDIGVVGAGAIVKYDANGYYLKLDEWIIGRHQMDGKSIFPFQEGDKITVSGQFERYGDILEMEESSVEIFLGSPFFSTQGEKAPIVETNYATQGAGTGPYFSMDENDAPYDQGWNLEYNPISTDAIKVVRDGTTYNVAKVGKRTIVKYDLLRYYLDGINTAEIGELKEGDIVIVDGYFVNAQAILDIPASYFKVEIVEDKANFIAINPIYYFTMDNGSNIQIGTVQAYGSKAVAPATDPVKEATAEYTYTFAGWYVGDQKWDPEKAYEGETIIKAKFDKKAVEYTVSVSYADGTTEEATFTVENKAEVLKKLQGRLSADSAEYKYTNDLPAELPMENCEYKERKTAVEYTITFAGVENVAPITFTVETMATVAFPAVPEKAGYTGAWDKAAADVTLADMTVNAVYTAVEYTITFAGVEGVAPITFTVETMATVEFPAVPAKAGYTGAWDKTAADVTLDNMTVTASYTIVEYTATIVKADNTTVDVVFTVENAAEKFAEIKAMLPADTAEFTYAWEETMPDELALADVTFKVVATAVEQPEPEQPQPEDPQPEESKGGCGSSIVGIGAAVTLLGAAAIVTMKKKED